MKSKRCARLCVFLYCLVSMVASLEEEEIETEGKNETDAEDYDNETTLPTMSVLASLSPEGDQEVGKTQSQSSEEKAKPYIPTIPELSPVIKDSSRWLTMSRLVLFYTPWCIHSDKMGLHLLEVMKYLHKQNKSDLVSVGRMDISLHSDVARVFKVKSTPTLVFIFNGSRHYFDDDITTESIIRFVEAVLRPALKEVEWGREVVAELIAHPVVFLLVHDEVIDKDWQDVYSKVAKERTLIGQFLYTTNPDLIQELDLALTDPPGIVVMKDGASYRYNDVVTRYRLTVWVESEQFRAFPLVNITSFRPYMNLGPMKRIVVLVADRKKSSHTSAIEAVKRMAVSRKMHTNYEFVLVDDLEFAGQMLLQPVPATPFLCVWEPTTGYHYPHEDLDFTDKSVRMFLHAVAGKRIEPRGGGGFTWFVNEWYWWFYGMCLVMASQQPVLTLVATVLLCTSPTFLICSFCCRKYKHKLPRAPGVVEEARAKARRKQRERDQEREGLRRRRTALEEENDHSSDEGSSAEEGDSNSGSEVAEPQTAEPEENPKDK